MALEVVFGSVAGLLVTFSAASRCRSELAAAPLASASCDGTVTGTGCVGLGARFRYQVSAAVATMPTRPSVQTTARTFTAIQIADRRG